MSPLPHKQRAPAPAIDAPHSNDSVPARTTRGHRSTARSVLLLVARATTARPSADSRVPVPRKHSISAARHRIAWVLPLLQAGGSTERELAEWPPFPWIPPVLPAHTHGSSPASAGATRH